MELKLDINKILQLYKARIAELEHELILQTAKCSQLEEQLEQLKMEDTE